MKENRLPMVLGYNKKKMNKAEITITSHSQEMKRGTVGQTSLRENKLLIRLLQIQQLS